MASRARATVAAVLAAALGCATSDGPAYVRGAESYLAGRCAEAHDELARFVKADCLSSEPDPRCQQAVWMQVQCDMRDGLPARAVLDANVAEALGPPAAELDPPIEAVRRRGLTELQHAWASDDRSVTLAVRFRDETSGAFVLRGLALSVDLRAPVTPEPPPAKREARVLDVAVPASDHLLTVVAKFSGRFRGRPYEMAVRSARTFVARPHEAVQVLVRAYERPDAPLAAPGEQVAIDFVFASAAPPTDRR